MNVRNSSTARIYVHELADINPKINNSPRHLELTLKEAHLTNLN